jgi:hypothetical protein
VFLQYSLTQSRFILHQIDPFANKKYKLVNKTQKISDGGFRMEDLTAHTPSNLKCK